MEEARDNVYNQNEIQNQIDTNVEAADTQPDPPHHEMDLNLSRSSMHFLRANGPDLNLDEVF